jgi:hypothetical protein
MSRIPQPIKRQPIAALGAAITTFVVAGIGVVNAIAPDTVTQDRIDAITLALGSMWAAFAAVWALVTPAGAPKLPEGTEVLLPDGTTGRVERA